MQQPSFLAHSSSASSGETSTDNNLWRTTIPVTSTPVRDDTVPRSTASTSLGYVKTLPNRCVSIQENPESSSDVGLIASIMGNSDVVPWTARTDGADSMHKTANTLEVDSKIGRAQDQERESGMLVQELPQDLVPPATNNRDDVLLRGMLGGSEVEQKHTHTTAADSNTGQAHDRERQHNMLLEKRSQDPQLDEELVQFTRNSSDVVALTGMGESESMHKHTDTTATNSNLGYAQQSTTRKTSNTLSVGNKIVVDSKTGKLVWEHSQPTFGKDANALNSTQSLPEDAGGKHLKNSAVDAKTLAAEKEMLQTCYTCGASLVLNAKFCSKCGARCCSVLQLPDRRNESRKASLLQRMMRCLPFCRKKTSATSTRVPVASKRNIQQNLPTVEMECPFHLKPSVGTWLVKPSKVVLRESNNFTTVYHVVKPWNEGSFFAKPSVGTWLAKPFKLSNAESHCFVPDYSTPSEEKDAKGKLGDITPVKVVGEDPSMNFDANLSMLERDDDETLLDLISPGFEIHSNPKLDVDAERVHLWHKLWPQRSSAIRVHPANTAVPTRRPHPSQPQRMYIPSDHIDTRSTVGSRCAIGHHLGTDIDVWRDGAPVRHRIVQRVKVNGERGSQCKVERVVANYRSEQMLCPNPFPMPDTSMSGWYRIHYPSPVELSSDLQLLSTPDGAIFVGAVAAGGIAQSAGVCAGLRVTALNGNSEYLREQLGSILAGAAFGHITLDLINPMMQCHTNPSYGDVWARTPLSTPGFVDYGM